MTPNNQVVEASASDRPVGMTVLLSASDAGHSGWGMWRMLTGSAAGISLAEVYWLCRILLSVGTSVLAE